MRWLLLLFLCACSDEDITNQSYKYDVVCIDGIEYYQDKDNEFNVFVRYDDRGLPYPCEDL